MEQEWNLRTLDRLVSQTLANSNPPGNGVMDGRTKTLMTDSSATGRKPIGTLPITLTLATSIGLLVAIAVFAELFIGFSSGRRNTLNLLNEKAVMMMGVIETGVRNHLDPAANQLAHLQHLIDVGLLDPDNRDELSNVIAGALAAAPQISGISYWDKNLQQTVAILENNERASIHTRDQSANAEIRALVARAEAAGAPFWDDVAFDSVTLVNVVRPIYRESDYIGTASAAVTMPELSRLMERVGELFEATAFIQYGSDHVLAHPFLSTAHPDLSAATPVIRLARVGDMLLANINDAVPVPGFGRAAEEGVTVSELEVFDDTHVLFSRQIRDYGPVPWTVGAHVPVDLINDELARLVGAALIGIAVFLMSVAAAVILGHAIARPVKRSAAGAAQIATLELAEVKPLAPSFIRELNDQAEAFNVMLKGLRWFETYVPKTLVNRLIRRDDAEAIASREQDVTLMFTDIVGFTSLSESLPANEVAELLNHHLGLVAARVEAEGGTIDKFIGDAVMAFWGAPDRQDDHPARAARAARAICAALDADNEARQTAGLTPIRIRIGIHTGPVVVGNIGAPGRINYTIVGDAVNTGQRIEAMAKDFDDGLSAATVLFSAETVSRMGEDVVPVTALGAQPVRGRSEMVDLFQLVKEQDGGAGRSAAGPASVSDTP